MQTIQESLQAEYDELYEHYQVSSHCMHFTTCIEDIHAVKRCMLPMTTCLGQSECMSYGLTCFPILAFLHGQTVIFCAQELADQVRYLEDVSEGAEPDSDLTTLHVALREVVDACDNKAAQLYSLQQL